MQTNEILLLILLAFFSAGLGRLYQLLIQPNQLLGFVSKWLVSVRNKFIFKSFGGCEICNTQRFAELNFVFYIFLTDLVWWFYIPLFLGYGGFVYWLNVKKEINPITKSQNLEL